MDSENTKKLDRRTFLKGGLIAGGAVGAGLAVRAVADATSESSPPNTAAQPAPRHRAVRPRSGRPNILVIVVDQLRFPQWFSPNPAGGEGLPPNLLKLREGAVSFARHYTVSNDCTPSRSALLTGLYTHQTGCMITGGSTLDPGFPTWGSMLRELGYHTRWYGKWHLTHGDSHWNELTGPPELGQYGFSGGTFPSPDGAPGQGWRRDPRIAKEFEAWFAQEGDAEPWCTTVSFVNPHDIAWWYEWTDRVPPESSARHLVQRLPPNFETPTLLHERRKPRLQRSLQSTAAASFGPVPFGGPELAARWLAFMDLYVKLQRRMDHHIGQVMHTLESNPAVAANTVVVFTSDHGEYGGSHGLRGKGGGVYDEGIRVPLIVRDPRGELTRAPEQVRTQLTSSVDVAPLLLTIATGGDDWRTEPRYRHLAGRADIAAMLADPTAPGRDYVLHATDEVLTEYAIEPYAANAPLHVTALRTPTAKYATYSYWPEEGTTPLLRGRESELYDYTTHSGRLELHNSAGHNDLEEILHTQLERALREELRAPLAGELDAAHGRGFENYFLAARHSATAAAARRKLRSEELVGQFARHGGRRTFRHGLTPSPWPKRP